LSYSLLAQLLCLTFQQNLLHPCQSNLPQSLTLHVSCPAPSPSLNISKNITLI
jgi:hypothetical protein